MKLCKDCANFKVGTIFDQCMAKGNRAPDYINGGEKPRNTIDFLRSDDRLCGSEGKWFEQRTEIA